MKSKLSEAHKEALAHSVVANNNTAVELTKALAEGIYSAPSETGVSRRLPVVTLHYSNVSEWVRNASKPGGLISTLRQETYDGLLASTPIAHLGVRLQVIEQLLTDAIGNANGRNSLSLQWSKHASELVRLIGRELQRLEPTQAARHAHVHVSGNGNQAELLKSVASRIGELSAASLLPKTIEKTP
tara:strand:- start:1594 stop:2151 length:558 start_codon:yes stop_codon:yes gene_type:complete